MTRERGSRATRQPGKRIIGQASSETIIILVLVALATVVVVTFYGRHVGKKFSCAGESVANGGGAAAGCSGEASGGVEVDAVSGADPRVASSAPGAGTATGGAAQRTPGEAIRPEILPVVPTPLGGAGFEATPQPGQPAVVDNAPVVPSSVSRSASSGAPAGKARESADDLSDFLDPKGVPGSNGAPLAGQSLANAPALPPSVGSGSGTASGGTTQQGARQPAVVDIPPPVFKGDGGPGTASRTAPLQTFDELVPGGANPLALPGSGFGSSASRQQVNDFILGGTPLQRLNEATDLLHKTSEGAGRVNGIVDQGTIIEVRSADGSSKLFSVSHPFKEFHDDTFGRVPERGVIRDSSRVVVEEVKAGSANAKAPRIIVNDSQTAGEIALELFRQRRPIRLEPQLDASVRAAVDADDRAKARQDFVKKFVDLEAGRAFSNVQLKKELQRQGATVNTTLPFEAEHQAAFNKAFAEELAKGTGAKAAVGAGTNAADRAVTDAVQKGGVVADRLGKAFDQRFDQFVKENPDKVKEGERRRRTDDLIKGLAGIVNKVDPKSPEADKVIALVDAIVPLLSGADQIRFIYAASPGLDRLLGPFGFRTVEGVDVGGLQRDRLEYALAVHAALKPEERDLVRRFPIEGIKRHGIRVLPTDAELRAQDRLVAVRKLPDGTLHVGPLSEFREAVEQNRINHALEQLEQIRGAGPFSLLGRAVAGEEGAVFGAGIDLFATIRTAQRARANVRAGIRNSTSGGHVVRGGPGGAGFEPVSGPGVRAADRLVPPPRSNVKDVGPDLAKRPATEPGAGPQPPRPPAPPDSPIKPGNTGNPPAQNRTGRNTAANRGQETGVGGNDTGVDAGRAQRRADQKVADARRQQQAKDQAARAERNARRQADLARRVANANANLERQAKNLPRDDQNISADEAISRAEKGDFSLVVSLNGRRHQEAFEEKILAQQLKGNKPVDVSKRPPLPNVFTDGKQVRINFESLTDAQKARVEALAKRTSPAGPAGGGTVDPQGNTQPQVDPRANTQPQVDPRAQTQPQVNPRADTVRFEGQRPRQQQVRQQQARREKITAEIPRQGAPKGGSSEEKTGEITRPGLVLKGTAAASKGAEDVPGKFSSKDVVFGLSVGDPKKGPIAKFAGNALNAANPDHLPLSGGATTPDGIATETVAAARTVLAASGGTLRFSLAKFSVDEALTPGSKYFDTTTSIEFRRVLTDPFFRGRVRFYDDKGVDITDSIVNARSQR